MIPALKAEFRKLLSVRSTYVIPLIAYALLAFVLLYIQGYRNGPANTKGFAANLFLANSIVQTGAILSIFGAIVALLLMTHEYRYNTIMYSLTIANRRSKVLLGKVVAIFSYIVAFVALGNLVALGSLLVGLHVSGSTLPHQDFTLLHYFAQTLFYSEAWAFVGLLLAVVLRSQVATIAVLFIVPNTVEGLLSLLLKENSKYLPFTALSQVVAPPAITHGIGTRLVQPASWTPPEAALLFLAYLLAAWVIAWILFLKRDAN